MTKFISVPLAESLPSKLSLLAADFARLPKPPVGAQHLVYCDGACKGNPGPGGWGAVVISADAPGAQLANGVSAQTTNNKMELTAAIESLKALPRGHTVTVRTDSQYVIKGCTEWRKGWVRNGMKNVKKEPVANADLWQMLWAEVDARSVKFEWVRGHNGDPGNELADALAGSPVIC